MSSYRIFAITLPLLLVFLSCEVVDTYVEELHDINEYHEETHTEGENHDDNSILEITGSDDKFSLFTEAVMFAGLEDTLKGNNQLTLLAPNNDAFSGLFEEMGVTPEEFFVDENRELLKEILFYHIISGNRLFEDIIASEQIRTLQSSYIFIREYEGHYHIGNEENGYARLVETDIRAANGVVHVIDSVLLYRDTQKPGEEDDDADQGEPDQDDTDPDDLDQNDSDEGDNGQDDPDNDGNENDESEPGSGQDDGDETILEIITGHDEYSLFAEALTYSGIGSDLDRNKQYTVFVPANDAFSAFLENFGVSAEEFFVAKNKKKIRDILLYHITTGNRSAKDIASSKRIKTLQGSFLLIKNKNRDLFAGNSKNGFVSISATDINARNGVVHVIDGVLIP